MQAAPDTRSVEAIAGLASVPERRGFLKLTPAHLGLVAARVADGELSSLADTLVIGGEALGGGAVGGLAGPGAGHPYH